MTKIRITKQFTFEMAHALLGYDGLCQNIHGHSYHFDVTLIGEPIQDPASPKYGMIMDFGDLKRLVNEEVISAYDHALLLNDQSDKILVDTLLHHFEKIVLVPFQPTTENLLADFAKRIQKKLPSDVRLFSLKLRETDSSFAELYTDDNFDPSNPADIIW
ncbi:MAG: 6-carboxytetrahydropterin synthase [Bacteroidales bacterium]|jgi:6-pyruvoyltetrahydropterin/6-carboxytetrahydropterin synthase|nr:6-carboxytetrahydropterin synthase [Bacteroidales bacterium]